MDVAGERILIFGDSLSHHGDDDGPEIWDVDRGANRTSSAPGDLLASMLLDAGAEAVRIDANVGRSARNFWAGTARRQHQSADDLIASDRVFAPTKVVIMLGTNDADSGAIDQGAMTAIRDAYAGMGAEVWGIGPPVFTSQALNRKADQVYTMMGEVFGARLIDARPLSSTQNRAGDGVHFQAASARPFAEGLFASLTAASGSKIPWKAIAFGVVVVGVVALALRQRSQLQGPRLDRRIATASLREERAAIRAYGSRLKRTKSKRLQAAIRHARAEERQHAASFARLLRG